MINSNLENVIQDADVVIAGGGIVGATVFRELCLDGLNVVLVEKEDFCCDISSGSTEMAHGGFRYLLTLKDWPLVTESLVEREILHHTAPHLVRRLNFYMPLYRGDEMYFNPSFFSVNLGDIKWRIGRYLGYGTMMVGAGMKMYEMFAKHGIKSRNLNTDPSETSYIKMKPGEIAGQGFNLNPEGLAACYKYTDSKIEDVERLVIENILSGLAYSKEKGTACAAANGVELKGITGENEIVLKEIAGGKEFKVRPRIIINATGARINEINAIRDKSASEDIHLIAGSHMVIPRSLWSNSDLDAAIGWWTNKKIMFAISKGTDRILLGTHERYIPAADVDKRNANYDEDVKGIVNKARKVFPGFVFDKGKHVLYSRVRPLKPDEKHIQGSANPTRFSRRDYIREIGNMISVTGKLGPSRCLAEQVATRVFRMMGRDIPASKSGAMKLYGGNFDEGVEKYIDRAAAADSGLDRKILGNLIKKYGSRYVEVISGCGAEDFEKINPGLPDSLPLCALLYSMKIEGARDMIQAFRRTGTYRQLGQGLDCIERAAGYVGKKSAWDAGRVSWEIENYKRFINKSCEII